MIPRAMIALTIWVRRIGLAGTEELFNQPFCTEEVVINLRVMEEGAASDKMEVPEVCEVGLSVSKLLHVIAFVYRVRMCLPNHHRIKNLAR